MNRRRMTQAQRRAIYDAAKGCNEFPKCNLCPHLVLPRHDWVVSHVPVPHAWEGREVGVAHKRCNDLYWRTVEAPMLAKARHQYDMARGIKVSRRPLPGGKDDPRRKKVAGPVVDRRTGELWSGRGRH